VFWTCGGRHIFYLIKGNISPVLAPSPPTGVVLYGAIKIMSYPYHLPFARLRGREECLWLPLFCGIFSSCSYMRHVLCKRQWDLLHETLTGLTYLLLWSNSLSSHFQQLHYPMLVYHSIFCLKNPKLSGMSPKFHSTIRNNTLHYRRMYSSAIFVLLMFCNLPWIFTQGTL
jgi:hypothetical protein